VSQCGNRQNVSDTVLRHLRPAGDPIRLKPRETLESAASTLEAEAAGCSVTFYPSGTAALAAAATAAVSRSGVAQPEVLIPAYGCPDLLSAVIRAGATPRLVDLSQGKPWMCLSALGSALESDRVAAVVAVNFLGISERLSEISRMARARGVPLISDCAQAFTGLSHEESEEAVGTGHAPGSEFDALVLSFGRGKPISLLGGGALLCPVGGQLEGDSRPFINPEFRLTKRVQFGFKARLYNLLINPSVYWLPATLPWLKLGETAYRPIREVAPFTPASVAYLRANVSRYRSRPRDAQLQIRAALSDLEAYGYTDLAAGCGVDPEVPLLRYPVLCSTADLRNRAMTKLSRARLGSSAMYGHAMPDLPGVPRAALAHAGVPEADDFAIRLLTLPVHEDVAAEDVQRMRRLLMEAAS
jgi:dTDP-4-amino-4,6-dideoxygalactose transaminase